MICRLAAYTAISILTTATLNAAADEPLCTADTSQSCVGQQQPGVHCTDTLCVTTSYPKIEDSRQQSLVLQGDDLWKVQIRPTDGEHKWQNVSVLKTIPRNGNGCIYDPKDRGPSVNTCKTRTPPENDCDKDGVEKLGVGELTMSWVQFEYNGEVEVKIEKLFNKKEGLDLSKNGEVFLRPVPESVPEGKQREKFKYVLKSDDASNSSDKNSLIVVIPFDKNGRRVSIEVKNDIKCFCANTADDAYIDCDSTDTNQKVVTVGRQPRNALLLFASPTLTDTSMATLKNQIDSDEVYVLGAEQKDKTGSHSLNGKELSETEAWKRATKLVVPAGVYWMEEKGADHLILGENMVEVELQLGAYLKSAVQFTSTSTEVKIHGRGTLYGGDYVYTCNPDQGYVAHKNDTTSLRMLWHRGKPTAPGKYQKVTNQKFIINGITVAAPPFNVHDFCFGATCGRDQHLSLEATDYKQVGAFFMQTDGLMPYSGSISNSFFHVNDDGLKLYYSDFKAENVIFWKANNDPIVQFGWQGRNVSNIAVTGMHVIHSRYTGSNGLPEAIVGASDIYCDQNNEKIEDHCDAKYPIAESTFQASFDLVSCEGVCPPLFDVVALQNVDLKFKNVLYVDGVRSFKNDSRVRYSEKAGNGAGGLIRSCSDSKGSKELQVPTDSIIGDGKQWSGRWVIKEINKSDKYKEPFVIDDAEIEAWCNGKVCLACTPEQCRIEECPKNAPYLCLSGKGVNGCDRRKNFWPARPDCDRCCDSSAC